jgi:hypothetical protein
MVSKEGGVPKPENHEFSKVQGKEIVFGAL